MNAYMVRVCCGDDEVVAAETITAAMNFAVGLANVDAGDDVYTVDDVERVEELGVFLGVAKEKKCGVA